MDLCIRPLNHDDETILWEMQYYASLMDVEGERKVSIYHHPTIACYVRNWGNPGDFGFAVIDQSANKAVGAAWCRLLGAAGFGYVDVNIPELSVAVLPAYRRQGVGTALLTELLVYARQNNTAISLAVRSTNRAVKLYEKMGFVRIPDKDFMNRSAVLSYVMLSSPETLLHGLNED